MNTLEMKQAVFCRELAMRLARSVEDHEGDRMALGQNAHIWHGTPENSKTRIMEDIRRLRRELSDLHKMFEG